MDKQHEIGDAVMDTPNTGFNLKTWDNHALGLLVGGCLACLWTTYQHRRPNNFNVWSFYNKQFC